MNVPTYCSLMYLLYLISSHRISPAQEEKEQEQEDESAVVGAMRHRKKKRKLKETSLEEVPLSSLSFFLY